MWGTQCHMGIEFFFGVLNGDDLGMVYGIGFTTLNDLVDGFKHVLSPIHRHGMHCHEPNDTLKTQNQPCDICDQKPSMIIPVDFQYVYPRLDDIRLPFDPITRSIWDAPSLIKNHQNLGCVIFFFLHIFPTSSGLFRGLAPGSPRSSSSQIITAAEQTTFGALDVVHRWGRRCQLLKEHDQMSGI